MSARQDFDPAPDRVEDQLDITFPGQGKGDGGHRIKRIGIILLQGQDRRQGGRSRHIPAKSDIKRRQAGIYRSRGNLGPAPGIEYPYSRIGGGLIADKKLSLRGNLDIIEHVGSRGEEGAGLLSPVVGLKEINSLLKPALVITAKP